MPKEAVFTMKLEPDLREAFMSEAQAAHRPASQVLRELMRDFVQRQRQAREYDDFLEQKVQAAGFQIGNVDATIICQKPKLADFLPEMVRNIASDLAVTPSHVNLKAKTNESLGHLGRGEGVAVHAVALLYKA